MNTVADAGTRALLERGAPLLQSISDAVCRTPNGRDHCGALHGVWADLRLLGLAAEPSRHAAFYSQALRERAADGASARVLVAGCADWGMLDTVAAAYRNAPLNATVVDRCPTPVLACAWYGAETGLAVRTAVGDVADWGESAAFDVICTHSLLTYAALDGRRRLVANWRRLLRPGGVVVTVSRLTTEPMSGDVDALARRFAELAVQRREQTRLERDPTALRARAERFARAQVSHPVGTEADLRELFEGQGFAVTRLDVRQLEGTMGAREPVGGAARTGAYGEIVAVRQ